MENLELNLIKVDKEEIEGEILNISEENSENKNDTSLNYENLLPEEKKAIDDFLQKLEIKDTTSILQYGAAAQNKISKFSDNVLSTVKTKSTGEVGDLLSSLAVEIKEFNTDVPKELETKGIAKLFTSTKKQIEKIIARYNKVDVNIAKIEKNLENHKLQMLKDIAIFDTLYENNLQYFKELSLYIIAGEKKLEELRNVTLPELQKKAEESKEQMDIQAVNDMINIINRFEKKLYDLKTTRIISIQMAPQIRLIQNNDSELVDKIQSSIINTIPLWKNQMVIALGLTNAKNALGAQKQVTDLTNDMLKQNSELLKQGTIQIAEESEKAIVDIETLQSTNKDIIETLDKVLEIHENGRQKREAAEVELEKIEGELKDKLLEIKIASGK